MNWQQLNKTSLFFVISSLFFTQTFAQDWSEIKEKYSGYDEYILQTSQTYKISIENDQLKVLQDNYYESVILSDIGIHNNQESFTYSELVPLMEYDAYTIVSNNGKEKKIPISRVVDVSASQDNIFYSDVKEKKITYSNLEVGAKKVYAYTSEFVDPYLLHKFLFAHVYPTQKFNLEIITDKNIELGYKTFNDPGNQIQFSKTEKKGKNVYTWHIDNAMPLKYEGNTPGYLHIVPHIIFYVKNYKTKNQTVPVLGEINDLYRYYSNFVKNINLIEDENLKETTLSLVQNLNTEQEKIKAILYWVKNNIKYVAFEDAYAGFIPREAKLVYERRFGDCKDMSSIITEMAKYAGVSNVNLTWIGSRNIPYSYHEIATPAVDDHMIAVYETDGKVIFLDATDDQTIFGLPSSFIQGKEAMIRDGDNYKIIEVPVVSSSKNLTTEKIDLSFDKNLISGTGTVDMHGLSRSSFLASMGDRQNKDRFEVMKSFLELGNNKFLLKNYKENNIKNRDLPYEIQYDFDIDNYLINADDETYVSLFVKKPLQDVLMEKNRVSKYEFDHLIKKDFLITLNLPVDFKAENLPHNVSFDNDLMKYNAEYSLNENKLMLNFSLETKKLLIAPADFELWNKSIKNLNSIYNETIVLTQNK